MRKIGLYFLLNFLLSVAIILMAHEASAESPLDSVTGSGLLATMKRLGYSGELSEDSDGDPKIVGVIDGTKYVIFFYNCTKNVKSVKKTCTSIQFRAGWTIKGIPADFVNTWNRSRRFGKAYIDDDGDPVIELSVLAGFGVSERYIEETFDWWKTVLLGFEKELRDRKS